MGSNAAGFDFSKFVPGFDFLKQMAQPQGVSPAAAQWIAPTADPDEVARRIEELKTVLFWLEQNATALKATIQALEVQRLTLTTLRSMNVGLHDMAQALQQASHGALDSAGQAWGSATAPADADTPPVAATPDEMQPHAAPVAEAGAAQDASATVPAADADEAAGAPEPGALDQALAQAGQWWGGMLQTFQAIAQQANSDAEAQQAAFAQTQQARGRSAAKKPSAPAGRSKKKNVASAADSGKPARKTVAPKARATAQSAPRRAGTKAAGLAKKRGE